MQTKEITVEIEDEEVTLDVTVEYEIDQGEPAEYPSKHNETGYPGSPSSLIIHHVTVDRYECKGTAIYRDGWSMMLFEKLDEIAEDYVKRLEVIL
jgi:hypothetical protein